MNLARAAIVDEDALYAALADGHLAGAALDVFRDEPLQSDNRFVGLPNVLVSPHLGGATRDVVRHQTEMIVDGIAACLRGERPLHIVNPAVLDAPAAPRGTASLSHGCHRAMHPARELLIDLFMRGEG